MIRINAQFLSVCSALLVSTTHFLIIDNSLQFEQNRDRELGLSEVTMVPSVPKIESRQVSHVFGIEYIEKKQEITNLSKTNEQIIRLNDVSVRVIAISTIGDEKIVYLQYKDANSIEEIRVKMQQGDELLDFTLAQVNESQLDFISKKDGSVVSYRIFKRQQ